MIDEADFFPRLDGFLRAFIVVDVFHFVVPLILSHVPVSLARNIVEFSLQLPHADQFIRSKN